MGPAVLPKDGDDEKEDQLPSCFIPIAPLCLSLATTRSYFISTMIYKGHSPLLTFSDMCIARNLPSASLYSLWMH